jgi:hypothetical protein
VERGGIVRIDEAGGAVEEPAQLGLGARALEEGRPGGAAEEGRLAREERRDHPRRPGEEDERLEEVALGRERPGAVDVPLYAREGEVRVRRVPRHLGELLQPVGEALAEAGEPLRRLGRVRVGGGEAGGEVGRSHRRPAS